ncbi:MAG: AAA family ATPase [Thermoplasmata archaeon]|nr:AAA family ATPase [Thermoplasmata archaeon]
MRTRSGLHQTTAPEWVALTGTPGTGKSSVGRLLRSSFAVLEVVALARSHGAAVGKGRASTVDLPRLRTRLEGRPPRTTLVVGHLSHLLPVDRAVLLRCHPLELAKRLSKRRSLSAGQRHENVVSEAIDLIRWEIAAEKLPVIEIDTTEQAPPEVAATVRRALLHPARQISRTIDWLSDPAVTEELLRRVP